jgi:hypothetical protein
MKKVIILSIAAVAVFFFSLAINTNVKNNTGSIDLKSALQSANAATYFAHDSPGGLLHWSRGYPDWSASTSIWWTITQGLYVTQSYSSVNLELKTFNAYKPCCLYNPMGQPCNTQTIATTIYYYDESGQVSGSRSTTFYAEMD